MLRLKRDVYLEIFNCFEMKPWIVKKETGGVRRKALREYENIIRLTQIECDEPTSVKEEKYDTVTREALHVVKKQCFLNQNPEKDSDVIPGNSSDINRNTKFNFSELDNDSYQEQPTKIQQGSVQQQIISDVQYSLIYDDPLPVSSSNNSDDEQENEYMKNIRFKNDLRTWSLQKNISQAALKDLLLILNKRFTDILPSDPRTILQTPTAICLKTIEGGEYWHHGIIIPLSNILKNCIPLPNNILLNINLDGLPIFKSSKYEFWPILANFYQGDTSDPFIIGIYYGKGKPKDLNSFLEDFVNEMSIVLEQGVFVKGTHVNVKIRCFICDSPARAYVKGVCNFNGKNGCLKCTTVGDYSHKTHTVVYSTKRSSARTDENFRRKMYGSHHKMDSPLLKLPIDMIEQFPVSDSLHLIHLGIMKRLLIGWRDGSFGSLKTKWSAQNIENVNVFLNQCKLPSEIHRSVRGLDCLAHWKASEFGSFLHYLSIIILPDVLEPKAYSHFLTLFCGVTICSSQNYVQFLQLAREMLDYFVDNYKQFYGADYITSNVHNLLHLVDEVERFGPLTTFNAYPFENKLYAIKNMLRQGNKPLSQVAKRLSEQNKNGTSFPKKTFDKPFLTKHKNDTVLHFEHFVLSCKFKNKYFISLAGDIIEIKYFSVEDKLINIHGKQITEKNIVFEKPIRSSFFNIYKVSENSILLSASNEIKLQPKDVKSKLVCINRNGFQYFLPLLHTV